MRRERERESVCEESERERVCEEREYVCVCTPRIEMVGRNFVTFCQYTEK